MVRGPRQNPRKQQRPARRSAATGRLQPPMLATNIRFRHRYRFDASADFSGTITFAEIAASMGTIGTVTNTTVTLLCNSLRILSVEMWAPPASQGAASTCSIDWYSTTNQPAFEFSDTTISTAVPSHVQCRPPPFSLAAFWQPSNSGANAFTLVAPKNTIIDLTLEGILIDEDGLGDTLGVTTAVIGHPYYIALDGPSSNKLVPVSMVTTS